MNKITDAATFVLWGLHVQKTQPEYVRDVSFQSNLLLSPDVIQELKENGLINADYTVTKKGTEYLRKENQLLADVRRLVNNEGVNFFKVAADVTDTGLIFFIHLLIGQLGVRALDNPEFWEPKLKQINEAIVQAESFEDLAEKWYVARERNTTKKTK